MYRNPRSLTFLLYPCNTQACEQIVDRDTAIKVKWGEKSMKGEQ